MNETEMIEFLEKMNDEDVPNFIGLLTQKKDFFFLHYYRLIEIKEKLEESFIDNYWHQFKTGKYTDDFVPQFNLSKADLSKPKYELVHSHIGRKTFITISLEKGVQPHILMKSTGHTKYDTMFRKYSKISENTISREFRQKLGRVHPSNEFFEKKEKEMYYEETKFKLNPKYDPNKHDPYTPQWLPFKVKKKRPQK
jgi:hypothetical protein